MSADPHSAPGEPHTPAQAATVLGVSKRQVLNFLNSGELVGTQDPDTGRWSIPAPHVEGLRRRREEDQRKKPPKPDQGSQAADRELVDTLREQVEDLRGRLDVADQRDREQRRIIAALTSRIPELPEATEANVSTGPTHTPTDAPGGPHAATQSPQATEKRTVGRSLWRRIFGS